jgi:hypothetical protein
MILATVGAFTSPKAISIPVLSIEKCVSCSPATLPFFPLMLGLSDCSPFDVSTVCQKSREGMTFFLRGDHAQGIAVMRWRISREGPRLGCRMVPTLRECQSAVIRLQSPPIVRRPPRAKSADVLLTCAPPTRVRLQFPEHTSSAH